MKWPEAQKSHFAIPHPSSNGDEGGEMNSHKKLLEIMWYIQISAEK